MRRDVVQGARSVLSVDGHRDLPVHRRLSRSDQMGAPQLVVMCDSIFQIDFEICYVRLDLGFRQWYFWYCAIGLLVIVMIPLSECFDEQLIKFSNTLYAS